MVLAGLAFIYQYGTSLPVAGDWELVPYQIGAKTPDETLDFLWSPELERRLPLPLALQIGLGKFLGVDNRVAAGFAFLALGILALTLIEAARNMRGWTEYADAFFPAVLLQLGFSEALFWAGGLVFVIPTLLAGIILALVARRGIRLKVGGGVLAGVCLLLLSLCGIPGLVYVPALSFWLGCSGVRAWRSPRPEGKRDGFIMIAFVLATLLLTAFFFTNFQHGISRANASADWGITLETSLAVLTASFGPLLYWFWPFAGYTILLVLVVSAGVLVEAATTGGVPERARSLGLLIFLAALTTLALVLGWTHGNSGVYRAFSYYLYPVLTSCWVYLAWCVFRPTTVGFFAQAVLFTFLCLILPLTIQPGLGAARHRQAAVAALEQDVRNGVLPYVLLARHAAALGGGMDGADLTAAMILLRQDRLGPFRKLQDNPHFRELPLALEPVEVNEIRWEGGSAHGTGAGSYLTFALPQPIAVAGIRLKGLSSNGSDAVLQLSWKKSDAAGFPEKPQAVFNSGVSLNPLTVFIADMIDQVRIYPDVKEFDFRIAELVLLVPVPNGQPGASP